MESFLDIARAQKYREQGEARLAAEIAELPRTAHWQFHGFTPTGDYVASFMALDLALAAAEADGFSLYNRKGHCIYDSFGK